MDEKCSAHGEIRNAYNNSDWKRPRGTDYSEDMSLDGRTIFKWIIRKQVCRVWTGLIWLRTETVGRI
jgi:hypothetical protein